MAEGPSRVERVLNLLAALLDTSRPLTRDQLVGQVSGYPEEPVALRRAFERDKELLRAMNVPITMTALEDGVEQGYRVVPSEYYLPELDLTADEAAALHVAVNAVALGASRAGEGALMKLGPTDAEGGAPIAALPMAPALPKVFDAFRHRATLSFEYRGAPRVVEPYGVTSKRGRWYVVGHDRTRDAIRTFRADRIDADALTLGPGGEFSTPEDFDAASRLDSEPWQFGGEELLTARVWVARDAAATFAPRAEQREASDDSGTIFEVLVSEPAAFRSFVLSYGNDVEVLDPPELRASVRDWLAGIATR